VVVSTDELEGARFDVSVRVDGDERFADSLGGMDWESARRLAAEGTELRPGDLLVSPCPGEVGEFASEARIELDAPSIGVLRTSVGGH
jgi:hypothetical protein